MDKATVIQMLQGGFQQIHEESRDILKTVSNLKKDELNYFEALLAQIISTGTNSLLAKTPKVPRKRNTRIKAIPENDELNQSDDASCLQNSMSTRSSRMNSVLETSEMSTSRAKRGASVKAADIIKKQQSLTLNAKLKKPSDNENVTLVEKTKENRSKRPKEILESSDDENTRPMKQSKVETKKSELKNVTKIEDVTQEPTQTFNETYVQEKPKRVSTKRKLEDQDIDTNDTTSKRSKKTSYPKSSPVEKIKDSEITINKKTSLERTMSIENKESIASNTRSSSISAQNLRKTNVNETMDICNANETVTSIYEDAIGKPGPMNSTMNPNSTVTLDRMMNVTVLLEPLSCKKMFDETLTITKPSFKHPVSCNNSTLKEKILEEESPVDKASTTYVKSKPVKPTTLQSQGQENINEYNDLLTEDESSPERKEIKAKKEKIVNKPKRVTRSNKSLISDDDEVIHTPVKITKQNYKGYKQPALFSPYAKDSVKKRVEAFEQVAGSPKQLETAGRITRTKTRALAAATETPALTVSQKLARKSLAKAKKISLAKQAKEIDDTKENENSNIVKPTKSSTLERSAQKQSGKTTPLGKTRMITMPSSVTKNNYTTPSNSQYANSYSKTLTVPRGNIVSNIDSFIQPMKSASKQIDRAAAEERRRRVHEEDARRKRDENLKAQAEEKRRRREEKELKNKLAREAKEKLDYEKRLKAEKEKEEKAKLAQQMQEKQKEEMERKRMAALQRALEKEERRKQEEIQRLHRLQEQEEQERLLAEQKRREQEMEKRKQAEMRQQIVENKLKIQMEKVLQQQQAKAKALASKQAPCNYKIDSDPDEEESDDENKPKHEIPNWASKNARKPQLAMQQFVPMRSVLKFFNAKKCTPDLRELFRGIDPKKLKRSSSAIWKTPPRYSMMNCSIIRD